MKKIWKYHIPDHSFLELNLGVGARPVKVGMQYNKVVIWIEFEDLVVTESEYRVFKAFPTGGEIPSNAKHIDTIFDSGYVWHVYEIFNA